MKSIDAAIATLSTLGSIVFFNALEAKGDRPKFVSDPIKEEVRAGSDRKRSPSTFDLPEPLIDSEGELRYPVSDIDAPGTNPYFDTIGTLHWELEDRPFEVSVEKEGYSWTAEDGLSEQVMGKLASNMDMLNALRDDNQTAKKRQLVYHDLQLEENKKAVLDGNSKKLVLPGLDGEVFEVEVLASRKIADESYPDELHNGFINGKIHGQANTKVIVGMSGPSYSAQIQSSDRLLEINTRKEGEFIVTEYDLELEAAKSAESCRFGEGQHVGQVITE